MSSILHHSTIYETAPIKVAKNEFLHLPKNIGRVWSPKFATGLNVIIGIGQKYMSDQAVLLPK